MERQYDIDEVIKDYIASSDRRGRLPCAEVEHLRRMKAAGATYAEVEMGSMCDRGPWLPIDTIIVTHLFNTPADAAEIQERYAYGVTMHDWAQTRPMLEHALRHHVEVIAPAALVVLLGWMRENHPDLAGYLAPMKERMHPDARSWLEREGVV